MPTYEITEWPTAGDPPPPWRLDADEHAVEAGWHVFRRTAMVIGSPRAVVVRRLPETAVARIEVVGAAGP